MNLIEENLGYSFKNRKLLFNALHHSSVRRFSLKFERLEFLGDRVLGLVIAETLFKKFQQDDEGDLARIQAMFVCADACHKVAKSIGLNKKIVTAGKHLMENKTVLADAMEALLGAIFLDSDFDTVREIVFRLWGNIFEQSDLSEQDPKTHLQEICQERTGKTPEYVVVSVSGPDHDPTFRIMLKAVGKEIMAEGRSKKAAEIAAAKKMLEFLR